MLQQTKPISELTLKGLAVDIEAPDPTFESKKQALLHLQYRRLLRVAFYEGLNRKPPVSLKHLPSYVRAVRKKWDLQFSNSARRLLANIEGFASWEEAMAADE